MPLKKKRARKPRKLQMILYTDRKLTCTESTSGSRRGVLTKFQHKFNCVRSELCTEERHAACVRSNACEKYRPSSEWEIRSMLGLSNNKWWKGCRDTRQQDRWYRKVKKILAELLKNCRPVWVTIEEA